MAMLEHLQDPVEIENGHRNLDSRHELEQGLVKKDSHSMSSQVSLTSTDSCVSCCSDLSVDLNPNGRENQDLAVIITSQENGPKSSTSFQVEKGDSVVKATSFSNTNMRNFTEKYFGGNIWDPPEAEDSDDDMECSVSNIDEDDDEYGDGTVWGKPTSLSNFERQLSGSFRFKEERQKAMEGVVNGKFKTIVNQLFQTYGITSSGVDGDIWTDIITSLSWEAACYVKPHTADSRAIYPDGYVKVKCIATGRRSQSQLIKGLVFKKNASHKHMPKKYNNPRLLLIRGALDQSLSELSSFGSMEQEQSNLESIVEKLAAYSPHVILVEKSAARLVQEYFLAKGMTLILDLKLPRLQRIARCTGSPIISPDNVQNEKLKHCDSFNLEKFVEEHAVVGEGGKKPCKTLMFLEGFPTRLGCTVLLMGASSDELKRIKNVVKDAIVMAHHLILETSFLVDQKVMFSSISCLEESPQEKSSTAVKDISISDGINEGQGQKLHLGIEEDKTYAFEPYSSTLLTGLSFMSPTGSRVIEEGFLFRKLEEEDQIPILESSHPLLNAQEECIVDKMPENAEIPSEEKEHDVTNEDVPNKQSIPTLSDADEILIMMSIRNASKGTICEQIHYTRIRFYKDLDMPLGRFIQETLFNQARICSACSELPGAHFYYYAYRNKQLTIQVKRIPDVKCLPGEQGGKLWMWSRCSKCRVIDDILKSTNRVLISAAARDLSFGKFLDLSFSQYSTSRALCSCRHFLHRDFLHFFGIGKMVAMFSFSGVATYTVARPPRMLEFKKSIKRERLGEETEKVHTKGMLFFREIEDHLQKLASKLNGLCLYLHDSVRKFSDVEELLIEEKTEFKEIIQHLNDNDPYQSVEKFLKLNLLKWELLLQSCIWEHRLHDLLSIDPATVNTQSTETSTPGNVISHVEIPVEGTATLDNGVTQFSDEQVDGTTELVSAVGTGKTDNLSSENLFERDALPGIESTCNLQSVTENLTRGNSPLCGDLSDDRDIQITPKAKDESISLSLRESYSTPTSEISKQWMWTPFSELRQEFVHYPQAGHLPIFEPTFSSTPELLPIIYQLIIEEGQKLHIPFATDDMVTCYDGELSSIIACALALLKDQLIPLDVDDEDMRKGKVIAKTGSLQNLSHMSSVMSPSWSSASFVRSDGSRFSSLSLDESRLSSFNGQDLLDSLLSLEAIHPEIPLGATKINGKSKYSVGCLYAGKFRDLRNRCCPSEHDYIASLSRCRIWNAKGGKSKAVFAKTLDDRFIIKEIKKTELDSFTKFAPNYFKYMIESFELGNPTCLAKILGIYQVTIRQTKGGKEIKHDLMVMENLTFGRKVSKQYDLKGALHDRFNSSTGESDEVFLDQNFVNDMSASPLYLSRKEKHRLERALWNDTVFLNSIQVMDYSLLVGVDAKKQELVCGIIDYLRQYTWDKQLETWVKSSLVVPKNLMPTVVSPIEYKKRFRKFMSNYFLWIPDEWCSQEDSDPTGSKSIPEKK